MTRTMFCRLGPSIATRLIASRMKGTASAVSMMRLMTVSTQPPEITREDADRDADEAAHDDGGDADDERDARAPDDAAQDVAALLVGAEPVGVSRLVHVAGRFEVAPQVLGERVERREQIGHEGEDDDEGDEERAENRGRPAFEFLHGELKIARPRVRYPHRFRCRASPPCRRQPSCALPLSYRKSSGRAMRRECRPRDSRIRTRKPARPPPPGRWGSPGC